MKYNCIYCYNKYESEERDILCWCNFSLNKISDKNNTRYKIYNLLKNKPWIDLFVKEKFPKPIYKTKKNINWEINYYKKLNRTKFMICPIGNGLETYRFYDSLYSGAIPIVVKEGILYDKFKDLPVLILEKIEDFGLLTEEYLNEQYDILSKKFKEYQPLLDMNFWLKNIVIIKIRMIGVIKI